MDLGVPAQERDELDELHNELQSLLYHNDIHDVGFEDAFDIQGRPLESQPRRSASEIGSEELVFGGGSEGDWFGTVKSEVEFILNELMMLCRYDFKGGNEDVIGLTSRSDFRPAPREFEEAFGDAPCKVKVRGFEPATDLNGLIRRPVLAVSREPASADSIVGKSMSHLVVPEAVNSEVLAFNRWGTLVARTAVCCGLLVACVCVGIAALKWGQKPVVAASGRPIEERVPFEERLFRDAEETVRGFLEASSVEERQVHVMRADRFRLYEANVGTIPTVPLRQVVRRDLVTLDSRNHFVLQGEDLVGDRRLFFVDVSDEKPRLDWEATYGVDDIPFEQFRSIRPSEPTMMRVLIEPGDYYNFAYSDRIEYASYLVRDHSESQPLPVYVRRDSELQTRLATLFQLESLNKPKLAQVTSSSSVKVKPQARRMTLSLSFQAGGRFSEQAMIADVLAIDWVYHNDIEPIGPNLAMSE